jgi:hypothetical protein
MSFLDDLREMDQHAQRVRTHREAPSLVTRFAAPHRAHPQRRTPARHRPSGRPPPPAAEAEDAAELHATGTPQRDHEGRRRPSSARSTTRLSQPRPLSSTFRRPPPWTPPPLPLSLRYPVSPSSAQRERGARLNYFEFGAQGIPIAAGRYTPGVGPDRAPLHAGAASMATSRPGGATSGGMRIKVERMRVGTSVATSRPRGGPSTTSGGTPTMLPMFWRG